MGHSIEYFTTDKRSEIMAIAEEFAWCNVHRQENHSGSYHGNMHIHDDIICESYDDAMKKIDELDRGWYDDHAVRFKDKSSLKPNKAMLTIKEKMQKNRDEKNAYYDTHSVHSRKSAFAGCPNCQSKISIKHLRGDRCPVCGKDMRADYIIERLKKYDSDYSTLVAKYKDIERNRKEKCKVLWLIKAEVHC